VGWGCSRRVGSLLCLRLRWPSVWVPAMVCVAGDGRIGKVAIVRYRGGCVVSFSMVSRRFSVIVS